MDSYKQQKYIVTNILYSRSYFRTAVFQPNRDLYSSMADMMVNSEGVQKIKSVTSGTVAFGLQPISSALVLEGQKRGGNALGLAPVNQTWYVVNSGAFHEKDDETVRQGTHGILNPLVDMSKDTGTDLPYLFMNDAGWDQNVMESYGTENVAKLQVVRAKYDPGRVFQRLVPGGFKLP